MKTLFNAFSICGIIAILVGCNFPTAKNAVVTPNPADIATQVQKMLTSIPAQATASVPQSATLAAVQPTATEAATTTSTPTETPSPTASPTPTAGSMLGATPSPSAADPRATLGTPTRTDKFSTSQFWFAYQDEHVKMDVGNGSLSMTAINADGWHGWVLSQPKVTDTYLEVTAKPGTCTGRDSYGPLVRAPDGNHGYFFALSCDGQFRFEKWNGSEFIDLIPWKAGSSILKGSDQTNRIGVMSKGAEFTLFINGVQVGQASDSTYDAGVFGLFISSVNTPNFTVDVSEVDYWNLPS